MRRGVGLSPMANAMTSAIIMKVYETGAATETPTRPMEARYMVSPAPRLRAPPARAQRAAGVSMPSITAGMTEAMAA